MNDRNNQTAGALPEPPFGREVENKARAYAAMRDAGIDVCSKAEPACSPASTTVRELRQRRVDLQERMRRLSGKVDTLDLMLDALVD